MENFLVISLSVSKPCNEFFYFGFDVLKIRRQNKYSTVDVMGVIRFMKLNNCNILGKELRLVPVPKMHVTICGGH